MAFAMLKSKHLRFLFLSASILYAFHNPSAYSLTPPASPSKKPPASPTAPPALKKAKTDNTDSSDEDNISASPPLQPKNPKTPPSLISDTSAQDRDSPLYCNEDANLFPPSPGNDSLQNLLEYAHKSPPKTPSDGGGANDDSDGVSGYDQEETATPRMKDETSDYQSNEETADTLWSLMENQDHIQRFMVRLFIPDVVTNMGKPRKTRGSKKATDSTELSVSKAAALIRLANTFHEDEDEHTKPDFISLLLAINSILTSKESGQLLELSKSKKSFQELALSLFTVDPNNPQEGGFENAKANAEARLLRIKGDRLSVTKDNSDSTRQNFLKRSIHKERLIDSLKAESSQNQELTKTLETARDENIVEVTYPQSPAGSSGDASPSTEPLTLRCAPKEIFQISPTDFNMGELEGEELQAFRDKLQLTVYPLPASLAIPSMEFILEKVAAKLLDTEKSSTEKSESLTQLLLEPVLTIVPFADKNRETMLVMSQILSLLFNLPPPMLWDENNLISFEDDNKHIKEDLTKGIKAGSVLAVSLLSQESLPDDIHNDSGDSIRLTPENNSHQKELRDLEQRIILPDLDEDITALLIGASDEWKQRLHGVTPER
ncbi:hypothetical protein M3P05_09350 [Sansalvadorimonas sp. 2012CJ34-2]|uniref:Uncharacterized protein n=1 Tax=Parendozoicomonas callyspongiae TaxID=2942213 RepID=A0ABT0PFI2_9GAMM|nr:hypothetical protein [Sansalvadorimonas sp. 2012CJ34-2]MCL6270138.1 hypothetical protein [Sansalvadorimonas sp. 2012CJ34-2]